MSNDQTFVDGEFVVYPAHGVGKVLGVETQHVAGQEFKVFVIAFDHDRMTLRLPIAKARATGLRPLSTNKDMDKALKVLQGRTRIRRAMWSRRAQEYETKINSGNPASIAEVIRDLHRSASQPDQSFSERQIYKAAMERFTRELAAIESIDEESALAKVEKLLSAA